MTIAIQMDGVIQPSVVELPGTTDTATLVITRSWKEHKRWSSVSIDRDSGRFDLTRREEDSIFQYFILLLHANQPTQRIRGLSLATKFAEAQGRQLPTAISRAISDAFDSWVMFDAPSLDEAFRLPRRGIKRTAQLRRKRIVEEKIWNQFNFRNGQPADKALFEAIGKSVGYGATQTEIIFRASRLRTLQNYLNGGARPGRPRKKTPTS
jgi:hypothetical protein